MAINFTTREYVCQIYSSEVPEEEKIELLHQYHEQLDALKLKEQELNRSRDFMERFYKDWEQKLENLPAPDAHL